MRKILPFPFPPITSYPKFANLVSILATHESFENWLFQNHVQIHGDYNPDTYWISFYQPLSRFHYPLVSRQALSRKAIVDNCIDVVRLVINSINNDGYVYVNVDTHYIPAYQTRGADAHVPHDMFIYGYDDASATLFIADFFRHGRYSRDTTSLESFESAFHSSHISSYPEFTDLQVLNVDHLKRCVFRSALLREHLEDYLLSRDTSRRQVLLEEPFVHRAYFWGLSSVRELVDIIGREGGPSVSTARALHVLCDHKKLMKMRCDFLSRLGLVRESGVKEEYVAVERKCLLLRNVYLKGLLSGHVAASRVAAEAEDCILMETKAIGTMVVDLLDAERPEGG